MKYEIKVPKPCHQDWNKMTPTEQGKFCNSCKKEVVDFTMMTDQQLINRMTKNKNLCGRFHVEQLNKKIGRNDSFPVSKVAASIAITAMLGVSEPVYAQGKPIKVEHHIIEKDTISKEPKVHKDSIIIKGNVKDIVGSLPGVSITIKRSTKGTNTDFDGSFSMTFHKKNINSAVLIFSYLGYETVKFPLKKYKKELNILMKEDLINKLKEIRVGYGVIEKRPILLNRIKNFFELKKNHLS